MGSGLGCLCGAVPGTANTSRAGAAACPAPSVSHLRLQPVAKPVGFTSFLLQRTESIPPAGTELGGSLAKYRLSMILQGQSENHIPQMTAPLFPSKQIINRKRQLGSVIEKFIGRTYILSMPVTAEMEPTCC